MGKSFADRLLDTIDEKQNPSIVGLDPRIELIPEHLKNKNHKNEREAVAEAFLKFNRLIVDVIYDIVPVVKLQVAFYEQYGHYGLLAFEETVEYAKAKGLLVIVDAKRNDIGSTAQAYANAYLGEVETCSGSAIPGFDVDAVTVNPYLGWDGIEPFVKACEEHNKGIFILVKTSNPSSKDLQDQEIGNCPVFEEVAGLANQWGAGSEGSRGYRSIGAVVGATFPQQAKRLRALMSQCIFLVPGYGTQGASAKDVAPCFNSDGYGAVVNSSRGIIFAYMGDQWRSQYSAKQFDRAARSAAIDMRDRIRSVLKY